MNIHIYLSLQKFTCDFISILIFPLIFKKDFAKLYIQAGAARLYKASKSFIKLSKILAI